MMVAVRSSSRWRSSNISTTLIRSSVAPATLSIARGACTRRDRACDIHRSTSGVLRYLTHSLGHDETAIATWYNHWIDAGFQAFERLLVGIPGPARSAMATGPVLPTSLLVPQVVKPRVPARSRSLSDDRSDPPELHGARSLCCAQSGPSTRSEA